MHHPKSCAGHSVKPDGFKNNRIETKGSDHGLTDHRHSSSGFTVPPQVQLNEVKSASNVRKHRVAFELASTVFKDPRLLMVPDLEQCESEERRFSVGVASNGAILSVVYLLDNH